MHIGDDNTAIKAWLVKHYGDASRIVNDTIAAIAKKKKPNPTNKKDRYTFYSDIVIALLRLERLTNDKLPLIIHYLMNAYILGAHYIFLFLCFLNLIILSSKGS